MGPIVPTRAGWSLVVAADIGRSLDREDPTQVVIDSPDCRPIVYVKSHACTLGRGPFLPQFLIETGNSTKRGCSSYVSTPSPRHLTLPFCEWAQGVRGHPQPIRVRLLYWCTESVVLANEHEDRVRSKGARSDLSRCSDENDQWSSRMNSMVKWSEEGIHEVYQSVSDHTIYIYIHMEVPRYLV